MAHTINMTKKAFERLLNEKYGVETQKWGNGAYAAKTRPYGTYLRSSDLAKFNAIYAEYLATGEC